MDARALSLKPLVDCSHSKGARRTRLEHHRSASPEISGQHPYPEP